MKVRLPFLKCYRSKGRLYAYYRRGGLDQRIQGIPGSPTFLEAYHRIHKSFCDEPRKIGVAPGSFADLVQEFKRSAEWRALKPATRASYARYLDALSDWKGNLAVAHMPREFILKARDRFATYENRSGEQVAAPRRGDYVVALLRRVLAFAIERPARFGLRENPAKGVKRMAKSSGYQPWPAELIEKVLAEAPTHVALAVRLGLDTGQRIGDCIAMRWDAYEDGVVAVVQQKTGRQVWIPATDELRLAIEAAPRTATTILTTRSGRPWDRHHLAREIKAAVEAAGYTGYSFHGLRKSAADRLAEAGCSAHEIMAITGHATLAMVEGYTRGANQKRLAKAAIARLRENGSET